MVLSYRNNTTTGAEGYCILKLDKGSVYATNKTGMSNLADLAYNSTTKVLTFTTSTYMNCLIYGVGAALT